MHTAPSRKAPPKVRNDTVIVDNDIVIYEVTSYADNRPDEKIIKQNTTILWYTNYTNKYEKQTKAIAVKRCARCGGYNRW